MRRKIEAVIFDWAGTTVDFGCFAPVQAFITAFEEHGITPTVDEVREPMGMLKRDHIKTMLHMPRIFAKWKEIYGREVTEADIDMVYQSSESSIFKILDQYTDTKPYVMEAIKELRERGIKIGSTTGYTDEMMKIVVPLAKENGYTPDYWCSANATQNMGRPYPYMIFRNMQELQISSVNSVVKVGDTVADIKEGIAAGVTTIGVIEGSSIMALSREEYDALSDLEKKIMCEKVECVYKDCNADFIIQNMSELPALLWSLEK